MSRAPDHIKEDVSKTTVIETPVLVTHNSCGYFSKLPAVGFVPTGEQAAMPMSGGHRREASCRLCDDFREPVSVIYNLGRDILVDAE